MGILLQICVHSRKTNKISKGVQYIKDNGFHINLYKSRMLLPARAGMRVVCFHIVWFFAYVIF